jgi:hypothetical protein
MFYDHQLAVLELFCIDVMKWGLSFMSTLLHVYLSMSMTLNEPNAPLDGSTMNLLCLRYPLMLCEIVRTHYYVLCSSQCIG